MAPHRLPHSQPVHRGPLQGLKEVEPQGVLLAVCQRAQLLLALLQPPLRQKALKDGALRRAQGAVLFLVGGGDSAGAVDAVGRAGCDGGGGGCGLAGVWRAKARRNHIRALPQHFLYFFPLPQGHGSFLPIFRFDETLGRASEGFGTGRGFTLASPVFRFRETAEGVSKSTSIGKGPDASALILSFNREIICFISFR